MKFAHFFVERPVFASVLSILIVVIGAIGFAALPVEQYPNVVPPMIQIYATYPGASPETVATASTIIENELNGVEDMLYISSDSKDGAISILVTFRSGTNLDQANFKVQQRISAVLPKLPAEVRSNGITARKQSPNQVLRIQLQADKRFDQGYVSNYALIHVKNRLLRINGVGDVGVFGLREYALRVWLNPDKLAAYSITSSEVMDALKEQNVQVASGALGAPPIPSDNAFTLGVRMQGRFTEPRQFEKIIIKSSQGRLVTLGDVASVKLGARDYSSNAYINGVPMVTVQVYPRPGANALTIADETISTIEEISRDFPKGLTYTIPFNPTQFVRDTIHEIYKALFEALILVIIIVMAFLQSWRAALIPIVAIPISLIGSFALMWAFGFSLNNLSLLGLALAIGIVVDDAIVFVENAERNLSEGLSPREASHKTIDETGTAIIAIALVLLAVFVPTALVPGITGQFYRQFALTIAASTIISTFVSLTLTPAMCALMLRRKNDTATSQSSLFERLRTACGLFNRGFDRLAEVYAAGVNRVGGRRTLIIGGLLIYCTLAGGTIFVARTIPTGFIPAQDAGYLWVDIEMPKGTSLARADEAVKTVSEIVQQIPGVALSIEYPGLRGLSSGSSGIVLPLKPFSERVPLGISSDVVKAEVEKRTKDLVDATVTVTQPPAIAGLGSASGFELRLQDRGGVGMDALLQAAQELVRVANDQYPDVFERMSAPSSANTPQVYIDVDRAKARMLNVSLSSVFETIQVNLGGAYANDFDAFGRVYPVIAQSDQLFREDRDQILKLKVRTSKGDLVPLGSFATIRDFAGPVAVSRYNLFNSVPVTGKTRPDVSSSIGLDTMERLARDNLPPGIGFEWSGLAFHERAAAGIGTYIFGLSVLFVFLVLAALYESWVLPLVIILIVPLAVLCALAGVSLRGMDNNILTQVGFVLLIGLASKNAILIVEFARQAEEQGMARLAAVVQATRLRLRPILMTTLAFVFGVVPLIVAQGAGAELRQALGTAVFAGMLGVTILGLVLTPIFYLAVRNAVDWVRRSKLNLDANRQSAPADNSVDMPSA